MPTLVAIHEIVRNDAKGQREVVSPGSRFNATAAETEFFLAAGAARVEADSPVTIEGVVLDDDTDRNLLALKKAELVDIAAELEIEGRDGMTKPQLIEAIESAEAANAEQGGTEGSDDSDDDSVI